VKLNDAVWGALLLLFAAVVLVHVQSFPTIPGQKVGPGLFPGLIAVGLGICGAILVGKGVAARASGGERVRWFELDRWTRSRRHVLAFMLVVGVNIFYIALVDRLGFIPTGVVYLALLFAVFEVPPKWILPLAVVVTLGIHFAFYRLLKVPLPWGMLKGVAW
jgi:putative tricarboxylic transport membrane protein